MKIPLAQYFWLLITIAVIVWYLTITIYVAIRGSIDIKHMLARLEKTRKDSSDSP